MIAEADIKKITDAEYAELIDKLDVMGEGKVEPFGLFYLTDKVTREGKTKTVYIGVDNSSGDLWVEEFAALTACKKWLTAYTG